MIGTIAFTAAAIVAVILFTAEIVLRMRGFGEFPLFTRDPASTYRMASNQAGAFRGRARWRFDRFGIRSDENIETLAGRIVLLGDSVVEGGTKLDQSETLAALVATDSHAPVSAVACHGWALENELGALEAIPGWNQAMALVWVINSGDFDTVGMGESELSFPTRRPFWLLLFLLRRHIYRAKPGWWPIEAMKAAPGPHLPEMRDLVIARFSRIAGQFAGPIIIVGHAQRGEDISAQPYFQMLANVRDDIILVVPSHLPGWGDNCYQDRIHPNARGARLIADAILPLLHHREEA